jgi:hypothetical protein
MAVSLMLSLCPQTIAAAFMALASPGRMLLAFYGKTVETVT